MAAHQHLWVEDKNASAMMDNGWAWDCKCGAQKHEYFEADGSRRTEIIEA